MYMQRLGTQWPSGTVPDLRPQGRGLESHPCFDTAGWVSRPVKRLQNDLNCVEWDVKPYSTQSDFVILQ